MLVPVEPVLAQQRTRPHRYFRPLAIEQDHFRVYVERMTTLHKTITTLLSTVGLIIGGWLGYHLAGILGVLMFVPVGAVVGLCAGLMGWRIFYLLAFVP